MNSTLMHTLVQYCKVQNGEVKINHTENNLIQVMSNSTQPLGGCSHSNLRGRIVPYMYQYSVTLPLALSSVPRPQKWVTMIQLHVTTRHVASTRSVNTHRTTSKK